MNTQTVPVSYQPIVDMQFSGLHWIEASAGTGKTYTLSSLMVRIFLEKYLPNQVIATTFTRKAAAELKTRIRARLIDTLRYLEGCRTLTEHQVLAQAAQESDPLFAKVLHSFSSQIDYACERLKLVIDQLDELFVGTLDSFSQKLLREFAFESGKIERAEITDDAKRYTQQLIHDVLRAWIQQQPQASIDYLLLNKKLKSAQAYVDIVENSLNFASAQFQAIAAPELDLARFEQQLEALTALDLSQVQTLSEYYLAEGQYFKLVGKKWRDDLKMQRLLTQDLPAWVDALQQQGSYALFAPQYASTMKLLTDLCTKKVLNKCPDDVLQGFEQHGLIRALQQFFAQLDGLYQDLEQLDSYLKYYLAREVKQRLPQVLQQKGETTFAQQIRTLAEALEGEQGQRFASSVHAKFPLILVDEFQDTNQDQDNMLARIWRYPARVKQGCMIMVGDRKQAIYGFRGGDMLTFLKAHQDVFGLQGRSYQLIHNHRSVRPLVEVVDVLFQRQPDFGEQVSYTAVQAGSRPHPDLIDADAINPAPLRWLLLEDKKLEAEQVAWKIRDLLNQSQQGGLYFAEKNGPRALDANDIAVLSRNHHGLDQVQSALNFLGIHVNRPSKKSVFEHALARDVGAILAAIMHPYQEGKVKRALLSRLMGFNVQQLMQIEQQVDGLSDYIEQFDLIREKWFKLGFLPAWQYFLQQFQVWSTLVQQPSRDNERVVVNLRHLTELLSQHSDDLQGAHTLYHWYLKQLNSPMQREWELERKLSNDAGVQLMTIHQSKGLEFKVVFLLGADNDFKEMNKTLNFSSVEKLNPQTGKLEQQRIVAVNDKNMLNPNDIEQHNARAEAEQHRLWYVALTRASYRVYAMLQDVEGKSTTGLAFWCGHGEDGFSHPGSVMEDLLRERPVQVRPAQQQQLPQLYAQSFPQTRFYARGKTSFSYLAQHLSRQQIQDALALTEPSLGAAEDEGQTAQSLSGLSTLSALPRSLDADQVLHPDPTISWIQANFPMGTHAGNFLHEIFEQIDFQDDRHWSLELHRRFKNDYKQLWSELLEKYQAAYPDPADTVSDQAASPDLADIVPNPADTAEAQLMAWLQVWLKGVLNTPLHGEFRLQQLRQGTYLAEFPFYLALADHIFPVHRIQQLFAEIGISMPEFNSANAARYLNGSIDLVYYADERYHIADYKSNFLGTQQQDYQPQAIQDSMRYASYWLQAALYLVALHRYLKLQLQDYQIERDLGGASYLYLRGMNAAAGQGYYHWQPSADFILRLDAILGYFAEDKLSNIGA